MNHRLSASSLLAKIKQDQENAAAVKAYWEASLPADLLSPSQPELLQMVRTVSLDSLVAGIDCYAKQIAKKAESRERLEAEGKELPFEKFPVTTTNAKNFICATGRNIDEEDDPKDRPLTDRRKRRAMTDPMNPNWDINAWHDATNEERQKAMATLIATEKANPKPRRKL